MTMLRSHIYESRSLEIVIGCDVVYLHMPRILVLTSFLAVWVILTILALTWGFVFDWPDYYHVNYGVPMTWATHTLNTIVGPVDKWTVNLLSLTLDMLFWLGLMIIMAALILYIVDRKQSAYPIQR